MPVMRSAQEAPGSIKPWGGASIPAGWLDCDGAAYGRTSSDPNPQPALFAVIGTTYGAGDGATTFNVPDFRGRTVVGAGTGSGLTARARGATGGAETHPLTSGENAVHAHGPGSASLFIVDSGATYGPVGAAGKGATSTTANSGSGTAHNNMQPWACAFMIIKF